MAEDPPKLRLVDPDERAPEPTAAPVPPPPSGGPGGDAGDDDADKLTWISAAIPLCIGIAILAVGLAVSLRLLMDPTPKKDPDSSSIAAPEAAPTSTIDPLSLLPRAPTSGGETTTAPSPTTTAAPIVTTPTAAANPSLTPIAVGGPGAVTPPAVPAPTTGSARVRIFNGFSAGTPLEVWEIAGPTPVRYGTVQFGGLVEMTAGGRLLPSGVQLQLRFVPPGGDPTLPITDGTSSKTGPWGRNFTPEDGSSVTLVLSPNPGLRVVPIDNARVLGQVPARKVHVVPVVFHLVLEGTRTKRWAADGVGCLGPLSTDKGEFDVPVGTALRLASSDGDPTCAHTVTDAAVVDRSTAVAVVGIETSADTARLVVLPLG